MEAFKHTFKLFGSLGIVLVLIRVELQSSLPICLPDLILRGLGLDTQGIIELRFCNHVACCSSVKRRRES